jgi:hypothetical protein
MAVINLSQRLKVTRYLLVKISRNGKFLFKKQIVLREK